MPHERFELEEFDKNKEKDEIYIVKPEWGCQGKGITMTSNLSDIQLESSVVVQRYLRKPYLIDRHKFDLRLFVLITRTSPLWVFLYKDGLAWFAPEPYSVKNAKKGQLLRHLTNFSLSKKVKFNQDSDDEELDLNFLKRKMSHVFLQMKDEGVNIEELNEKIEDIVAKTLLSIQPNLARSYKTL